MTILNETTECFANPVSLVTFMIVAATSFTVVYFITRTMSEDFKVFGQLAIICIVIIVVIVWIMSATSKTYKYYDVTLDNSYPAKDLLEEYELVEIRGDIFTLRKEVKNDQAD